MNILWERLRAMFSHKHPERDATLGPLALPDQERHDDLIQFLEELEEDALIDIERREGMRQREDARWSRGL